MLSLHTGYDTAYLTDAVGDGQGADYYTGAAGEPPGYWQGAGAAALGLTGQVDAEVMRALYHEDVGPDGQVLGRRQRPGNYPAAVGIAVQADRGRGGRRRRPSGAGSSRRRRSGRSGCRLRAQFRTVVPFYDYTFSAPKSVSVLWASLLAASAEAAAEGREADAERLAEQAEQVRGAVKRANDRMIAVAERELAYVRTGHHSATSGEWRDASGFIVASFPQHTNRDGDPQLHVHNAIANRAQRADGADDKWRALHGHPLFRNKLRLGTLADRFLGQELERLGWRGGAPRGRQGARGRRDQRGSRGRVQRPGEGAAGPHTGATQAVRERSRARSGQAGHVGDQAAGRSGDPRRQGAQPAASRPGARRRGRARPSGAAHGTLSSLHWRAASLRGRARAERAAERSGAGPDHPQGRSRGPAANATWDRSQLIFELGQVAPPAAGRRRPGGVP